MNNLDLDFGHGQIACRLVDSRESARQSGYRARIISAELALRGFVAMRERDGRSSVDTYALIAGAMARNNELPQHVDCVPLMPFVVGVYA
ncbi:MAG TPA: hypothetical protein VLG47_03720 [Candidatus Saccharimonadales bacterium]|nr:hypothetical protein [Candidatus Saccharimonadales bacterium]